MDNGVGVIVLGCGHDDSRDIRMFYYLFVFAGSELGAYLVPQFFRPDLDRCRIQLKIQETGDVKPD